MAAGDLTTLPNVKQWNSITAIGDDALLTRLITSVSTFIRTWLNRQLDSAVYTESYDGLGGTRLSVANHPITAVASVTIDNLVVPLSTSPTVAGFTFDAYGILLRQGYRFVRGQANVSVVYTAGYATIPEEIEQAAVELVTLRYVERRRPGVSSQSVGGENLSYRDVDMTDSIKTLLRQYKKVAPT